MTGIGTWNLEEKYAIFNRTVQHSYFAVVYGFRLSSVWYFRLIECISVNHANHLMSNEKISSTSYTAYKWIRNEKYLHLVYIYSFKYKYTTLAHSLKFNFLKIECENRLYFYLKIKIESRDQMNVRLEYCLDYSRKCFQKLQSDGTRPSFALNRPRDE
jgi:hypothetical protein